MYDRNPGAAAPATYREGYDAARKAVMNYPHRAIRMQLARLALGAQTETQWGAVDALTDLLRHPVGES